MGPCDLFHVHFSLSHLGVGCYLACENVHSMCEATGRSAGLVLIQSTIILLFWVAPEAEATPYLFPRFNLHSGVKLNSFGTARPRNFPARHMM